MNVPQNLSRSSGARRAWAQPRFLLGAATLTLTGATLASFAQTSATKAPVAMPHVSTTQSKSKPLTLNDLPGYVERYGEAARLKSLGSSTGDRTTRVIGTGQTGFNLVETDLTPNSPSDERQPAVSPSGDFIAFMSNGADADGDGVIDSLNPEGKYHIWMMNRDGTAQRQLTGLNATLNGTAGDINRNQSHPSWSPDGNQIVYSDEDAINPATTSQLWVVFPLTDTDGNAGNGTQVGLPEQRTTFPGKKESPAWAPTGLSIAFVTNYDAINGVALPTRDIFSISPQGQNETLTRITGGTNDPTGDSTDDDHPAWGIVNRNLLFFSSNRDKNGLLVDDNNTPDLNEGGGRRIWRIFSDGSGANPVTDPLVRANGRVDDRDDFPAPSARGTFSGSQGATNAVNEQLAFQTNSYIDNSDQADGERGRDLNVWSLPLNTSGFTPPSVQAEPRVFVSAFTSNKVVVFNTTTRRTSDTFAQLPVGGNTLLSPESLKIRAGVNSNNDNTNFIYVSERGSNRVARFDEINGAGAPGSVVNPADPNYEAGAPVYAFTPSSATAGVPSPTGLEVDDNYVYVASGGSSTALYRFLRSNGTPAGAGNTSSAWSSGEDASGRVASCESIAIDPSGRWIAVSVFAGASGSINNKVNLYDKATGTYIIDYVNPTTSNGLSVPTGIAWGDDLNGDGFPDLYVDSSGSDDVKAYAGPDPSISNSAITRGAFIADVVADNNGTVTGLNDPEGLTIADLNGNGKKELYVSSFTPAGGGTVGSGTTVSRYEIDPASKKAIPWPATSAAPDPTATDATYLTFPLDVNDNPTARGAAGIAFDPAALAQATTVDPVIAPDETTNAANVLTNILSSPQNFSDSRLTTPQTVDRAADREPAFSRTTATAPTLASLVFASGRRFSPNTTSNGSTAPANPYGGDQNDDGSDNPSVTHDIWTTSTQDTTPPALIPQGAGNLQTPVVAPNTNSPYFAPRTAEAGLKPGLPAGTTPEQGGLRFAVVLRDVESGLNERNAGIADVSVNGRTSVYVSFYNADSYTFPGYSATGGTKEVAQNDETIIVERAHERRPLPVSIGGTSTFGLNVYDDGPVASGGHEQQASAVAGDGNFYCEGYLPTPAAGDYYIDVTTRDRRNNTLRYDRVWGISTRRFVPVNRDLFVSDYAGGQAFPNLVASLGDDRRFNNQPGVESYYLTNPGGTAYRAAADVPAKPAAQSVPQSFQNVDIWRILCRGPVTQDVLNSYRPSTTVQIDPNSADKTQLTRKVAVSRSAVIWAAPYAGTTFVGPGTIIDPTTQERLRSFLGDGGRLFISGRDIAYALTSNGSQSNTFLTEQLGADFATEPLTVNNGNNRLIAGAGEFLDGGGEPSFDFSPNFGKDYPNLRLPYQSPFPINDGDWGDGAETQDQTGKKANPPSIQNLDSLESLGVAFPFDYLTPVAANGNNLVTSYTHGGQIVGQRVEKIQSSGLQSRVVFFSFGFEAINRRYRLPTPDDGRIAVDSRYRVANFILSYFKTGSVSGTVINDATNKPIPGFLLQVTGRGQTYLARTDARGEYTLTGLPFGGYSVKPYVTNGRTDPPGFFGGTEIGFGINLQSPDAKLINLRPTPTRPGAIIGKAVASNGTPLNTADDYPISNIPVLVRSVDKLVTTDPAGYFARLTTTDAGGNFQVGQVPSGVPIRVIFNPNNFDPEKGDNQDVPASANIDFRPSNPTLKGQNPNFGRRELPDLKRPNEIIVPANDTYYLNDIRNDTAANETTPILVPVGPTLSGVISVNGTAIAGATVQLLKDGTPITTNPVQVTGANGTTGTNGAYSFVDVTPGTYKVRATITRDNINFVRETEVKLEQGKDLTQDININIATLTGKVVLSNGQAVANATVTLKNGNGTDFVPARTAKTNAQGVYTIATVPVGGYTYTFDAATQKGTATFVAPSGSVTYSVLAVSGGLSGSSGNFSVNALATNVTVQTITLVSQQVSGRVFIRYVTIGGDYVVPFGGAIVELVDINGNSLTPKLTTTSASNGVYSFPNATAGTYRAKVTGKGDEVITNPFTVTAGTPSGANATLVVQGLSGDVINVSGQRVQGATVTLTQNGTVLGTTTTDVQGAFSFDVAEGDGYALKAVKGSTSGSANVGRVVRGTVPKRALITLLDAPTVTPKPTSFTKGTTYAVSFPYETSTNATSRNIYDRSRADATIAMVDAFNYGPMGKNAAGQTVRFYTVSRFNPNTLAYEAIPDNGVLVRGEGYLLKVNDLPANGQQLRLAMPSDNPALKALTSGTTVNLTRFDIYLVYNSSLAGNGLNGRNLIGFGFDPAKYGAVAWDTTSTGTKGATDTRVQVFYNNQIYTVKDAAAQGIINSTLLDATTGRVTDTLNAYGGYFVTARKPGVALRLRFPLAN